MRLSDPEQDEEDGGIFNQVTMTANRPIQPGLGLAPKTQEGKDGITSERNDPQRQDEDPDS